MTLLDRVAEARAIQAWGDRGWSGAGVSNQVAGVSVTEETALALSAVWACQTLIADSIATMPQDVFRATGDGGREEVSKPRWLEDPNPEMDVVDFDTQRILSLLGWGEAYTLLVRDRSGNIHQRWPLDPARVRVDGSSSTPVVFVDNTRIPTSSLQRIIGYRLPGRAQGASPVRYGAQMLGLGIAAEKYDAHFFEHGSVASGVLEVPDMPADVSAKVVDRLRDQFTERYATADNAHRPIVTTGGTRWRQTSIDPEDAQLLETRKFQVSDVARWYRVPPWMIGDVERSTSWGTGIEVQGIGFVTYTLAPWLVRLERADSALLTRPRFVKRNVNALLRGDSKARSDWYRAGLEGEWIERDEIRAWEELPPLTNSPAPGNTEETD